MICWNPFDDCDWLPARKFFKRLGFEPIPPPRSTTFNCADVCGNLFTHGWARFYFYCTNHLSDCELYTWLNDHWFAEDVLDSPLEAEFNCHIDVFDRGNGDPTVWPRFLRTKKNAATALLITS